MNMSVRPRTVATWRIAGAGPMPVRFRLDGPARRRARRRDAVAFDRAWDFVGAALVSNFRADLHGDAFAPSDELLVANVLGRIRANLLLARTPLVLEEAFLLRDVVCADVRVARMAGAVR